jgi:hypothetical protein
VFINGTNAEVIAMGMLCSLTLTNELICIQGHVDLSRVTIFARDWWGSERATDDVLQWSSVPE